MNGLIVVVLLIIISTTASLYVDSTMMLFPVVVVLALFTWTQRKAPPHVLALISSALAAVVTPMLIDVNPDTVSTMAFISCAIIGIVLVPVEYTPIMALVLLFLATRNPNSIGPTLATALFLLASSKKKRVYALPAILLVIWGILKPSDSSLMVNVLPILIITVAVILSWMQFYELRQIR